MKKMIIIDRPVKILLTPLPNYVNRYSASENGAHVTIARYYRCTSGMPSIFRPLHDCSTSFSELLDQATNQAGNKKKRRKPQTKPTKEIKDKGDSTPRGWRGNRTRAWCRSWCCTPWARRWALWCCTSVSANWTLIGAQIRKPWSRRRPSPSALVAPLSTPIPMRFYFFFLVFLYCHTPIEAQLVPRD